MSISRVAAYARFLAAGSVHASDDEALGAAAMALAARFGGSMHLGLATRLARLSGGRPLDFDIGAVRVDGKEHGPWRAALRPFHETRDEPTSLSGLPERPLGADWSPAPPARGPIERMRRRASCLGKAIRGAADVRRDCEIGALDAASLGAALRPLMMAVEEKAGSGEAVFVGTMLARLLAQNVAAGAGVSRIQVTEGTIGEEKIGSWNLAVSTASADSDEAKEDAVEARLEGGVIRRADPPSARSRAARRFLSMDRIVELTTTYERDDDGKWAVADVGFRGEAARDEDTASTRR